MKTKVSRTYEKRPAKIETVIEEIEIWSTEPDIVLKNGSQKLY